MKTFHILISGKVQGVFFRQTAKKVAEQHSINGWIRNRTDGSVEAVVSGDIIATGAFISWCKKGPQKSQVLEVKVTPQKFLLFNQFDILR